ALAGFAVSTAGAVVLAATTGGVQRLVYRKNDVGNCDVARQAGQRIPAARAAHAVDQLVPAQFAEELFEIRKRDILALTDRRERYRTAVLPHGQVDHRGNRETPLCSEPH